MVARVRRLLILRLVSFLEHRVGAVGRQVEEAAQDQLSLLGPVGRARRCAGGEQLDDDGRPIEVVDADGQAACVDTPVVHPHVLVQERHRDALPQSVVVELVLVGRREAGVDEDDQVLAFAPLAQFAGDASHRCRRSRAGPAVRRAESSPGEWQEATS